jgi:hypothetical protein
MKWLFPSALSLGRSGRTIEGDRSGQRGGRSHPAECESAPDRALPTEYAGVLRRGLEPAARSTMQDERGGAGQLGLLEADRDDCPIAQGRHSV